MRRGEEIVNQRSAHPLKGFSFVVLFCILIVAVFFTLTNSVIADSNRYKTVMVKNGDSLWSIADKYHKENPMLTREAFISWVERENGINRDHIRTHTRLIIPVHK
ncbi:LysM peptidoglycan-binding domain-containing protein [Sporolactobacillus sp. THM7-4]|nr:LysM peptidoglycan-binding domain-containing protein [Sporolactobacillus sp. THM7-4]